MYIYEKHPPFNPYHGIRQEYTSRSFAKQPFKGIKEPRLSTKLQEKNNIQARPMPTL